MSILRRTTSYAYQGPNLSDVDYDSKHRDLIDDYSSSLATSHEKLLKPSKIKIKITNIVSSAKASFIRNIRFISA